MFGLNIDPRNPQGNPDPAELRALGVETVRFTFKDSTLGSQPDPDVARQPDNINSVRNGNHRFMAGI